VVLALLAVAVPALPASARTRAVALLEYPGPTPARASASVGAPGGLVAGRITAIGDSVMLDYARDLEVDLPGTVVDAVVGRQWDQGVAAVAQLRAAGKLGATVIIGLGTNGPVLPGDVASMVAALAGATRIVFVTVHVDRPWQALTNRSLILGARGHRNIYIANWAALAAHHPGWFYSDGTHLPIGGPGAVALAALVAAAVHRG
jgi:hypothetical protein